MIDYAAKGTDQCLRFLVHSRLHVGICDITAVKVFATTIRAVLLTGNIPSFGHDTTERE